MIAREILFTFLTVSWFVILYLVDLFRRKINRKNFRYYEKVNPIIGTLLFINTALYAYTLVNNVNIQNIVMMVLILLTTLLSCVSIPRYTRSQNATQIKRISKWRNSFVVLNTIVLLVHFVIFVLLPLLNG